MEQRQSDREVPALLMRQRTVLLFVANVVIIAMAYTVAFLLRFDLTLPRIERPVFYSTLPAIIPIQYCTFLAFKITRGWWRYVGVADFVSAMKAAVVGSMALAVFTMFIDRHHYPRSIFLIYPILLVGFSMGARLAVRMWRENPQQEQGPRRRTLIIGAGDTGETLLRESRQSGRLSYHIVAFVDDDPRKQGAYINGVPVVGGVDQVKRTVEHFRIDEIVVATPSASGEEMRRIIALCREAGVPLKTMPATWEVLHGSASFRAAREVDINDLLRRAPIELDVGAIGSFLTGKRVLITGAAGSIGSEICQQVLRFQPSLLLCLDHDENALFFLDRELRRAAPDAPMRCILGDITEPARIEALFKTHRPQVVFHAAAHKHVPMIEANPVEGFRNNVLGTELVATMAGRHEAEAFVLVSTDKAVNPSSLMGASKRMAECLLQTLPFSTRYTAVRFGNVLGSQGSVVPLLKEQIKAGGPVTITHPDMRRYFMTIPEAVELVLQCSAMGREDEIFILDMGEPVKILELARDLITLSGLRPDVDIPIVFSGVRPGEKLYEELYLEGETADRTAHPKILVARRNELPKEKFRGLLEELRAAIDRHDEMAVRRLVPRLVPEYRSSELGGNVVPITAAQPAIAVVTN